jgi:dihydroorotase-like cyclic amidohydrolase
VLLTEGPRRGLSLPAVAELTSAAPARRVRLNGKGSLVPGADADLVLVDTRAEAVVTRDELRSRHRLDPFVGRSLRGRVERVVLRGSTVCLGGDMVAPPTGRMVRLGAGRPTEARS